MWGDGGEAGGGSFPCDNYKDASVVKAIRDVLAKGRIGEVRSITLSTFRNTHAKGVPERRPDWRRDKKYGGGRVGRAHSRPHLLHCFGSGGGQPTAGKSEEPNVRGRRRRTLR